MEGTQVILSTPMAVKLLGVDSWVHICRLKPAASPPDEQKNPDSTHACEPLEDLKFLFKKKKP